MDRIDVHTCSARPLLPVGWLSALQHDAVAPKIMIIIIIIIIITIIIKIIILLLIS